jgi:hypothetical protein
MEIKMKSGKESHQSMKLHDHHLGTDAGVASGAATSQSFTGEWYVIQGNLK